MKRPFKRRDILKIPTASEGFTLAEVLLVMAITSILFGLSAVSLIRPQLSAVTSATSESLIADLKTQQMKSMSGNSNDGVAAAPHGIYIEPDRYTLFEGSVYDPNNNNNFVIELSDNVTLATTLTGSIALFEQGTGQLSNYIANNNITLSNARSSETTTIIINPYGALQVDKL